MNKYDIKGVIGDGTYGIVYEAINKETGTKVAIKKLKNKIHTWEGCIEQNEVKYLRKMNHPNIVKLLEVIREQNSDVSFIFEYCDCNLFELTEKYLKRKEYIPEIKIKKIIQQIIHGINYMHQQGIMHRDLKPENILYNYADDGIKIADFGVTRNIPQYKEETLTDYVCTRWYRAPECVLRSVGYDEKIDIWAIGCIMAELYTLKPIFPGESEFNQLNKIVRILGTPSYNDWPDGYKLLQKQDLRFPNYDKRDIREIVVGASPEAVDFLNYIFVYDPKKRPNCDMLLRHRYFNESIRPSTFSFALRDSSLNGSSGYRFNNNENNLRKDKSDNNYKNKRGVSLPRDFKSVNYMFSGFNNEETPYYNNNNSNNNNQRNNEFLLNRNEKISDDCVKANGTNFMDSPNNCFGSHLNGLSSKNESTMNTSSNSNFYSLEPTFSDLNNNNYPGNINNVLNGNQNNYHLRRESFNGIQNNNGFNNNISNLNSRFQNSFNKSNNPSSNDLQSNYNYLKNLNYANYYDHGKVLPDINKVFDRNMYQGNANKIIQKKNDLLGSYDGIFAPKFSNIAKNDIIINNNTNNNNGIRKNGFNSYDKFEAKKEIFGYKGKNNNYYYNGNNNDNNKLSNINNDWAMRNILNPNIRGFSTAYDYNPF